MARGHSSAGAAHLLKAKPHFEELGTTVWIAKTLILLAEIHMDEDKVAVAGKEIDDADRLLDGIESKEAARLRDQLEEMRAALEALDTVGCSAELL